MKYIVSSFVLLSLIFLTGCKKGDGNIFVTGTITQGGQPLEDVRVLFMPDGNASGEGAGGRTDKDGKYVLTTTSGKEGSGTKPGEYRVTLSKIVLEWDGKSYRTEMSSDMTPRQVEDKKTVHLLPAQYGSYAQTPLKATVTTNKDTNVFNFEIQ